MQHKTGRNCAELLENIQKLLEQILKEIHAASMRSRPPHRTNPNRRGPKDTRTMKAQRTALIVFVTVERHKNILDVTLADAHHVWHQPENVEAWNEAAKRKDKRRGYKDYATLYSAVRTLAAKSRGDLTKITAV